MLKSFMPTPLQVAKITPILAWYDSSRTVSLVSASGAVSNWRDSSGFQRNATQGTGANQPTSGSSTINSLNAVTFSVAASSKYLGMSNFIPDLTNGSVTIFTVCKLNPSAAAGYIFSTGSAQRIYFFCDASGTDIRAQVGSTPVSLASGANVGSSPFIAMLSINGSTDSITLNVNNANIVTASAVFTNNPTGLRMGAFNSGAGSWDGLIAEQIFYSGVPSATNQLSIFQYLSQKWAIPI